MRNEKWIPLYERLSRNNELQGESCSFSYKKQMLEELALQNAMSITILGAVHESAISCEIFSIKVLTWFAGHTRKEFDLVQWISFFVKIGRLSKIVTKPLYSPKNRSKFRQTSTVDCPS